MKVLVFLAIVLVSVGSTAFSTKEYPAIGKECRIVSGENLDFLLINKTGYDIEDIYVAPTTERNWGDDIMGKDLLENEASVEITFDGGETAKKWDIYVTWKGYEADEDVFWIGLDLSEISEITLFYDAESGKTWAQTK